VLSQADRAFITDIEPPLLAGELSVVIARLRSTWPPERLIELSASLSNDVVKLAVLCLGISGAASHCEHLAAFLKHDDDGVSSAAETAFWSVCLNDYTDDAHDRLNQAVGCMKENRHAEALNLLDALIAAEPDKAEAYHQRALALHSLERYADAETAYLAALSRNPHHFAAMAGLGHVHVEREQYREALDFYKRALDIYPRLEEIREIAPRLEAALHDREVA